MTDLEPTLNLYGEDRFPATAAAAFAGKMRAAHLANPKLRFVAIDLELGGPSEVEVRFLAVMPNHRRSGHGHRALCMITKRADKLGVTLRLTVHRYPKDFGKKILSSPKLQAWYERHGFAPVAGTNQLRRKPYKAK